MEIDSKHNLEQFYKECKYFEDNKKIKNWNFLSNKYGFISSEAARSCWKRYKRKNGLLSGLYQKDKTKILILADFHYPFNLNKETFHKYRNKVDILVLNGDLQDCQSLSKFTKKYRLPFIDELIGTRQFIIDLIHYINPKKVIINYGNHEKRLLSALDNKLSDEFMALMPKSSLGLFETGFWKYDHRNKTKTFYEGLPVVFNEFNIDIKYTDNWYNRIGNTIIAHPSAYKQGLLKTSEQAYLYFVQVGEPTFDCVVLSHTHACGFSKYGKTYLFEPGCLCNTMDYIDGKLVRPQAQGFLFLVQENGNIIYDDTKLECL